jgi:type IV pilus assembly protein PilP
MNTLIRSGVAACLAMLLAGCSSDDFSDLETYTAEVDARPSTPIEPLPPFQQIQPFAYQAGAKRQPFEPPVVVREVGRKQGVNVKPNLDRVKQYLEQFPIPELGMVGTLSQNQSLYALVRDPEGGVHKVQVGDYLGTDHGRITAINELELQLMEIVSDGTGGWVERARTVSMGGQEEPS